MEEAVFTDLTQSESPIVKYGWVFGDAGNSSVQNPSHTYPYPGGPYTVTLQVTDSGSPAQVSTSERQSIAGTVSGNVEPAISVRCAGGYGSGLLRRWQRL